MRPGGTHPAPFHQRPRGGSEAEDDRGKDSLVEGEAQARLVRASRKVSAQRAPPHLAAAPNSEPAETGDAPAADEPCRPVELAAAVDAQRPAHALGDGIAQAGRRSACGGRRQHRPLVKRPCVPAEERREAAR